MARLREGAELVGILAVVVGLFFVGFELQQNQLGLQAQTRASLAQIDIESIRSFRLDDQLMQQRVGTDPRYNSVEELRNSLWIREVARTAEHHFYQYRIGTFDSREFQGVRTLWKSRFSTPEYRNWWNANKAEFSTVFQDEFDALISED